MSKLLFENEQEKFDLFEPKVYEPQTVNEQIENLKTRVEEGYADALQSLIYLSDIEKQVKAARESVLEFAIKEFEKYAQKTVEISGRKISKTSGGTYAYNHIENWTALNEQKKLIEKYAQTAYKMQQVEFVIPETGEVIPAAQYKASEESLAIK